VFQREHTLRTDYGKVTKDLTDGIIAARQVQSLTATPANLRTPQQQQALIFSFMKMLDPSSVVRESEYASAARARSLLDHIQNYAQYIQSGQLLTPKQIANMALVATQLQESLGALRGDYNKQFSETARAWNVDPSRFIQGATPGGAAAAAPGGGRGTADSPIKVTPRAAGAGPRSDVVEVPY
jgi:hypothetical protein